MPREPITWLSTAEAAKLLGVTNRTLYRFINEGQLPAYKFGRVIRLMESDIDAFIAASRIRPGTLEHLYPDTGRHPGGDGSGAGGDGGAEGGDDVAEIDLEAGEPVEH